MSSDAAYMRRYRAEHPRYAKRNRQRGTARARALEALIRKYPAEFGELFRIELQRLGIDGDLASGRKPGRAWFGLNGDEGAARPAP